MDRELQGTASDTCQPSNVYDKSNIEVCHKQTSKLDRQK